MTTIHHLTICDQKTLGWTALRVEEEQGPELCVTVSELRRAREVYRDTHPAFPQCNCLDIRVKTLTKEIDQARKAGDDERYHELLTERAELRLSAANA